MKNTCLLLFLLISLQSYGQLVQSHQPQAPPINPGYPFMRSMSVDCADEIIIDIANNNAFGLEQNLIYYIRKNSIGYIILCDLGSTNIFGSMHLKNSLKKLMIDLRTAFPGIKIGIAGSEAATFQNTAAIIMSQKFANTGFPAGTISTINQFNDALNNTGTNSIDFKRSEICKLFMRAAQFGAELPAFGEHSGTSYAFDAFYVEYRYWNHTTSLSAMHHEFENFMTILSVSQIIKSNFHNIQFVDAEFLPSEMFTLQAWTAIDQITDADPLADRLMIPAFTGNVNTTFNKVCKVFHFLSDQFSKPNSQIFLELSAESSSFNYCNSSLTPQDHLGNYLNGTTSPSGNLYSVEKIFLDKFNDATLICPACSCRPYNDDHYSSTNPFANSLAGVLWTPYSMLNEKRLFRKSGGNENDKSFGRPIQIQIFSLNGTVVFQSNTLFDEGQKFKSLPLGIYLEKIIYDDGRIETKKIFNDR